MTQAGQWTRAPAAGRLAASVHLMVDPAARETTMTARDIIASSTPPSAASRQGEETPLHRRNILVGFLFGCGIVAFLDEAVFHQLLHWHHFYDRSTGAAGLVSDGLFHAFSWFATVASLFLFADLRRRRAVRTRWWVGGILVGIGTFQLFDGVVHHKVLGLHEIRYGVDLLPYDLVWNGAALAFLLAGLVVLRGALHDHQRNR
ncbi:Predicted membrane protein [Arthrobacter agilis]|nr:Predicted membrane protein [Arthrobacter agilis]